MKNVRRRDREIGTHQAIELLLNCEYGVLSTVGQDSQPYGIPLNYVYEGNSIYFHSALTGHKIENIENNPKVSFCVVGKIKVLPEQFSTEYESAVAFGVASEILGSERNKALMLLLEKYAPDLIEEGKQYIEQKNTPLESLKLILNILAGKLVDKRYEDMGHPS